MFAMFDYIEFSKYLPDGYYDDGRKSHMEVKDNHLSIQVSYNKDKGILRVKGSLSYFIQGHNFWFDVTGVEKAIDKISEMLGIYLYDAEIKIIEYGVVVRPHFKMKHFIDNHLSTKGYEEEIYGDRGKNYVRKDKSYTLKFYDIWANIDRSKNKVSSETRKILKDSCYSREHNPIRYEIHGNPQKILGCGKVFVSDLLSAAFEEKLKKVLLEKYRRIKKWETLKIDGMRRCDLLLITLAVLSEKYNRYQERILAIIDTLNVNKEAKLSRKSSIRKKFNQVPREKCSYSIESLIIEVFEKEIKNKLS